jgi:hypothetical protein
MVTPHEKKSPALTELNVNPETVTEAAALCPATAAEIAVVPTSTTETAPSGVTLAMAGSALDHATSGSVSANPLASSTVTVSCVDDPDWRVTEAGSTVTAADATSKGDAAPVNSIVH